MTTITYDPHTNLKTERYNKTLVSRLHHYLGEHQRYWEDYVPPPTYAYSGQVHRSTNDNPFSLVLSRQPPGPIGVEEKSAIYADQTEQIASLQLRLNLLKLLSRMVIKIKSKNSEAQQRQNLYLDKGFITHPKILPDQLVKLPSNYRYNTLVPSYVQRLRVPTSSLRPMKKLSPLNEI